jgi:hypothetical protein
MGEAGSAYRGEERRIQSVMGKPEGKRPIGRTRLRWEGNVKMDLQEVGCESSSWLRIETGGG